LINPGTAPLTLTWSSNNYLASIFVNPNNAVFVNA